MRELPLIPPCPRVFAGEKSRALRKREDLYEERNRLGIVRIIILLGTIRDVLIVIPANSFYLK